MGKKSTNQTTPEGVPPVEGDKQESKKKSKPTKKSVEIEQPEADEELPTGESAKDLKKKLREARTVRPAVMEQPIPEEIRKSKKRKQRSDNAEEKIAAAPVQEEPPRKKHKNKTEFADPRVDTSLNSQARKALEYAFLQMNKPSKWKFHKARQNWLIRNIWDPESISDTYFPIVTKYMANVKGGSREKLQETCESYLKVPEVVVTAETDTLPAPATTEPPKSILKTAVPISTSTDADSTSTKPTPGPLISPVPGALISPTPGALIAGPLINITDKPLAVTGPQADALLAEVRRSRAEIILEALKPESKGEDMET